MINRGNLQNSLFDDAYFWDVGNWLGLGLARDEHNRTNV